MNANGHTCGDIVADGGIGRPPCIGFAPNVVPEVRKPFLAWNSQTGVSPQNALPRNTLKTARRKAKEVSHWYVLRATYGREKKAYDYLVGKGVEAYYPTIKTVREVDGKRKAVEESRIPNIFFAHGAEEEIKSFVYGNTNVPYLRFYYRHCHKGARDVKEPLIIPDSQMDSFRIICASEAEDIILTSPDVRKFKEGQTVRITDGAFKGVIGKIVRYHGQQRVVVIIDGLLAVATAYVPSAFVEFVE